ncbi:ATP-grasp domain-containing protein [Roseiconus lacunae]|uniref:ATP-grasp domain-containing protein n=1 Tax=Roseiconus lacunae TaxID=2605694 RepID=A0ABT7PI91_9BACT|nr:ATP-grasp domain-containing protein [Roseiconus lacunae]MCD0461376.1 ATP-grasp domain-containing protein [Roseiconus lacunae]MDM4016203.1 ATP-grasp domain-containing protein [Roseiconus lacunae]WRQ51462.1 ATP-grasp domain-containing protein [Stieleria sp. HD01]
MKIFVGEYVCGGGLVGATDEAGLDDLRSEGEAMLRALVADVSQFAETTVVLDNQLNVDCNATTIVEFDHAKPLWAQWAEAARGCDAALVIAPEVDGLLAKGVAVLRSAGCEVIAGSGDFLRVASDKLLTAQLLHRAGVAHPPYIATEDERMIGVLADSSRFVIKPRDGCGTQEIQTFDDFREARKTLASGSIMQGWMEGRSISISYLASGNYQTFLPAVGQSISKHHCHYSGGCGPLDDESQRRATAMASRAIAAMPPTARGFIGLDLILGEEPSQDCVIEINPRLTTSYVGLREMIHGNLAARLFDLETGPVRCKAMVDTVRWTPDGKVYFDAPLLT